MPLGVKAGKRTGIKLSLSVTFFLLILYTAQTALTIYLVVDKFKKAELIREQRLKIGELEEKVKLLEVIKEFKVGFKEREMRELTDLIWSRSKAWGIDPFLILALIKTESSFLREVESERGARGLMQILPSTGEWLARRKGIRWSGPYSLYHPTTDVRLGLAYLFELILKFKDVKRAIIAYNLGESELKLRIRRGEKLPSRYLNSVMENYRLLLKMAENMSS